MTYKDFVNNSILLNQLPADMKQGNEEGLQGFVYRLINGETFSIELRRDMDGYPVFWTRCGKNSSIAQTLKDAEIWLWGEIVKQAEADKKETNTNG